MEGVIGILVQRENPIFDFDVNLRRKFLSTPELRQILTWIVRKMIESTKRKNKFSRMEQMGWLTKLFKKTLKLNLSGGWKKMQSYTFKCKFCYNVTSFFLLSFQLTWELNQSRWSFSYCGSVRKTFLFGRVMTLTHSRTSVSSSLVSFGYQRRGQVLIFNKISTFNFLILCTGWDLRLRLYDYAAVKIFIFESLGPFETNAQKASPSFHAKASEKFWFCSANTKFFKSFSQLQANELSSKFFAGSWHLLENVSIAV